MIENSINYLKANLTDSQFYKLSKYITSKYGIKLPIEKKVMLQSRLQKRLKELRFDSFELYIDYLFQDSNNEDVNLIDAVSTNKTDFYREPNHFDFITNHFLPEFTRNHTINRELKVWSAGCSSGEEPYTICFVFEEFMRENKHFLYSVYATDISQEILQKAALGIYKLDKVSVIPLEQKKRYLLKSKDTENPTVRVQPNIRKKVRFEVFNLLRNVYSNDDMFDIIFCRNVLIYFERQIQEQVVNVLVNRLKKGGLFFIGHSESLMGMSVPLELIQPTVFRKV